ncbi:hypothetical protein BDV96DRAFT_608506 [Lophiotrema nucula]|uniref:MARVEL domain-containing protein n=1 Tax=Lophiotrema nucula TaxID=690887 RepID=A0A6A5ZS03_9PLEO|nr:hypothetical protein BDV96DRAFT_608506 [Lophiotrema nucula]
MSSSGLSGHSSGHSSPLKPLHLVTNMDNPHIQQMDDVEQIKVAQHEDKVLKARIRRLRLVTRILAFLISIAVFVPITLTLHKFLTTQNVYHEVTAPDGTAVNRTAWHKDSKVWPTWMYFLVATISLLLNLVIIFSYKFGVKYANKATVVATTFSWIVMIGNLVVWSVAASLYRKEKKETDLWGWTCSPAARLIQKEFKKEVDFDQFCNVQSASWYAGLAQVGAAILTIITYVLVIRRKKTKKVMKRETQRLTSYEPYRH